MGAKHIKGAKPKSDVKMNKATRTTYYKAEFKCMGDVLGDERLNEREFTRLVQLLGLPDAARRAEILWKKQKRREPGKMKVDEYVSLMMDPAVDAETGMWRKLFAQFDTDGSGCASRQDVMEGLEKMGIPVGDEIKDKINAMDSDKNGRIQYGDFLKMQLLNK